MSSPTQIDGSMLEGGGQLLRVAVSLSAVTGKPIQVSNIRLKREKPGLRPQHLSAVKMLAELVSAETAGLEVGSKSITFRPKRMTAGNYNVDVGTAGSTTLILQALMPALAFAPGPIGLTLVGGTNNPLAPTIDYMNHVLMPTLQRTGYDCQVELLRRGFYPRGSGEVRLNSRPAHTLTPLRLVESSDLRRITIYSYSCRLAQHITVRMAKTAEELLHRTNLADTVSILESLQEGEPRCSIDPGCGLLITLEYTSGLIAGFDGLGERGKPAEKVSEEIVSKAIRHFESAGCVEPHLCDQLIIWMSLADGHSEIMTSELTLHALTCIEIAREILGVEFAVEGTLGEPATIRCRGIPPRKEAAQDSMQGII